MNKSSCPQPSRNKSTVYSQYLALESRLVFDGAVVVTAVEAQPNTPNNDSTTSTDNNIGVTAVVPQAPVVDFLPENNTPQVVDYLPNADTSNNQPNFPIAEKSLNPIDSPALTDTKTNQPTTIIVVDPRAENAASLASNPPANTQVIILDTTRDGFQQIAEQLQDRNNVTELHILPWTQDNQQWLGSQSLTATLEPSVSSSLMNWDEGLANDAKLVFHGQNSMGTDWAVYVSTLTGTQTSWSADNSFVQNDSSSSTDNPATTTIYFIDSAVQNVADIVSSIDSGAEIVYLDASKDGLTQIADYLAGRSNIDSIQIISHSKEATLYLGNETLTRDTLTDYTAQLATIGKSLTVDGDILFYGCELAKSTDGSAFIDSFSYLTQADVAASTDFTGATSKGGNWTLEYTAGTIEASILAASHYQDILALPVFDLAGQSLLFGGPGAGSVDVVKGTTGRAVGDITLFRNVVTINGQSIDAMVRIVNNTNITIDNLDSANGAPIPPARSRDPNFFELITTVVAGGSSTIKFTFIKSGTYNPSPAIEGGENVLLKNVIVNSYDVDENQFQDFSGFSAYTLTGDPAFPSTLVVSGNGDFTRFADNTSPPFDNQATPATNLAQFNQARVTAYYNEINTFQIITGSNITPVGGGAFFYLDFSGGPIWNPLNKVSYDIPTADLQTTNDFTPTLTGTYAPNVTNSTDTAQTLTVTVNGVDYTSANGLVWSGGTWSLTIPNANALSPKTYDVAVDTGYGASPATVTVHTKDITLDELVIINNPPVNTIPGTQTVNSGIQTAIPGLSVTDIDGNLASTRISVASGVLNVDLSGGATISSGANGSSALTLNGTEAQIKAALASVKYTGISNDTLTVLSTDSFGLSDVDTVAININTAPPIAVNDNVRGTAGSIVNVNVLGNDSDPDNNIDPTTVKIVGTTNPGDPLFVPGQGTWSVNTITGEITFTPIAGFIYNPTPINYTVKDTAGLESNPASVTITVNSIPLAIPDRNVAIEGGPPIRGNLINNDDVPGDRPAIVIEASQGGIPITLGVEFATAAGGFITINVDGSYSYRPPLQGGLVEIFNYTIRDTNGDISSTTLSISVPGTPGTAGTAGSLILLSNPPLPAFIPEIEKFNFFVSPRRFIEPKAVDLRLYIPTPDGVISLTGSLRDQVVLELQGFSFDIPSWSFRHTNPNAQLEFDATHPDGSALPSWLKFDPKFLRFSGIPPKGAHNEHVMVTVTDTYGQEVHAYFTVHVNKERVRPDHKSLKIDLKLMGLSKESENHHHREKVHKDKPAVSKSGLSERMQAAGKLGKLQESRRLLDRLKQEEW